MKTQILEQALAAAPLAMLDRSTENYESVGKNISQATADFQRIFEINPDNASQIRESNLETAVQAYANAIGALEIFISKDVNAILGALYSSQGLVLLELSRRGNTADTLSQAIFNLEKASKLVSEPENAKIYAFLGLAYGYAGNLSAAIASLENATNIHPLFAEAYLQKGLFHLEKGETDLAHDDIYWAITLDPDLYEEKYEPIMQAERETEAYFDELERQPEFQAEMQKRLRNL